MTGGANTLHSVEIKAKICTWYKALTNVLYLLVCIGLVKGDSAMKILCRLSGKGVMYKVGNRPWKRLNKNVEYETIGEKKE